MGEVVLGGENRTGEEEEQRILLETGGDDEAGEGRSSKMFDLFPHKMADMFRSHHSSAHFASDPPPIPTTPTELLMQFRFPENELDFATDR